MDNFKSIIEQIQKTAQKILYFIQGQNKNKTSDLSLYGGQICANFNICSFITKTLAVYSLDNLIIHILPQLNFFDF